MIHSKFTFRFFNSIRSILLNQLSHSDLCIFKVQQNSSVSASSIHSTATTTKLFNQIIKRGRRKKTLKQKILYVIQCDNHVVIIGLCVLNAPLINAFLLHYS